MRVRLVIATRAVLSLDLGSEAVGRVEEALAVPPIVLSDLPREVLGKIDWQRVCDEREWDVVQVRRIG